MIWEIIPTYSLDSLDSKNGGCSKNSWTFQQLSSYNVIKSMSACERTSNWGTLVIEWNPLVSRSHPNNMTAAFQTPSSQLGPFDKQRKSGASTANQIMDMMLSVLFLVDCLR